MGFELSDESLDCCCGVIEIGNFGEPGETLAELIDAWETDKQYAKDDGVKFTEKRPTQKDVNTEFFDELVGAIQQNPGKAFIATTIASQTHAIAALTKLKFTPVKLSHITLWYRARRRSRL